VQLHTIYGLVDPRIPTVIRYVGRTKTPIVRHLQHCSEIDFTPKGKWVESMRQVGVMPQMVILERDVSQFDASDREKHWIKECGKSVTLVNFYQSRRSLESEDSIPDPPVATPYKPVVIPPMPVPSVTLESAVADTERQAILRELTLNSWNVAKTAKQLGVSRPTLYDKLHRYGIQKNKPNAPRKQLPSVKDWITSL
jgi:hypothetical protein